MSDCVHFHILPAFGDVFSVIGVREPQAAASEAFVKFAEAHRNIEKYGIQLLKTIKPVSRCYTLIYTQKCFVFTWLECFLKFLKYHWLKACLIQMLHDLNTYLHKAIPDTKLTIRKYLDVKFEYLVISTPHHILITYLVLISNLYYFVCA